MKKNWKYWLLIIIIIYSAIYVFDEITIGEVTTGLYVYFNLPLGIIQLIFSASLLETDKKWQQIIAIIGIVVAILVLIPPVLLKYL